MTSSLNGKIFGTPGSFLLDPKGFKIKSTKRKILKESSFHDEFFFSL